jgi:hypothetical protein
MIVWRGRGYWVALIAFGCLLISDWLTSIRFHNREYYAQHGWPKMVAFFVAAGVLWPLALRREDEVIHGEQRYKEPFLRKNDSLFFIPARYWPLVLVGLGCLFYFVRA